MRPTLDEFKALAADYDLIPVYKEILADLETPVGAFAKLSGDRSYSFLFESVEKGEQVGRYSFIGCDPIGRLVAHHGRCIYYEIGRTIHILEESNPWEALRAKIGKSRVHQPADLPGFLGGAVGYMGYDSVRWLEPSVPFGPPGLWPEALWLFFREIVIFDHARQRLQIVSLVEPGDDPEAAYAAASHKVQRSLKKLTGAVPLSPLKVASFRPGAGRNWRSNVSKEKFESWVTEAKERITAGDIFQVVLSQRLEQATEADPLTLYRLLRTVNPSPYMFYLNCGDFQLIGSSPEIMVRLEDRKATLRPIAGTRKRGATPEADAALAAELLADPKEVAEHVMLIDLGRNDLGRVCVPGTVVPTSRMMVEKYSHVMHIVTNLEGRLRPELDAVDLLAACFPAGTVTGAPKVKAMSIIAQTEPEARGPYAGAVGYFGYNGSCDTGITLRTILLQDGVARVQAGAGIVADSVPAMEWQECVNKASALLEVLNVPS
ncbi:MAG: anthranilate synthase component I [Candidatus Sericytochromatia bacterium]|nr:anthranilate synthase component I [Candidatus Sericytochromatia bacterium]